MNPAIRKKLIEVSIPLEAINVASAREKSIRHGHPSTLHLWWARRPLAACRAILFSQIVDDPSSWPDRFATPEAQDIERRRLHRIIEDMVPWEASNNETILNAARWEIARSVAWGLGEEPPAKGDGKAIFKYLQIKAPPVYDPFSGGGSIPLEAQRLGLRAYGSDLNPVAVLIGKALVEIPPKFAGQAPKNPKSRADARHGELRSWNGAQGLAEDVRYYGKWMRDEAEKRIGHLYPKAKLTDGSEMPVIAWLWTRTVRSPDPAAKGAMVPLASSFMLATKETKKAWVEPIIDPKAPDGFRFVVRTGSLSKTDEDRIKKGTKVGRGSNFVCLLTGSAIDADHVKAEGVAGRMGSRMLAFVVDAPGGRIYLSPTADQEAAALNIELRSDSIDLTTSTHPQYMACVLYGLDNFSKFYTDRQLTTLTTFSDLVAVGRNLAHADCIEAGMDDDLRTLRAGGTSATAYADAIATYLAFAVSKSSTRSCALALWETGMGRLAGALGRQAFPMQLTYAETNPLAGAGGDIAGTALSVSENLDRLGRWGDGSITLVAAQQNTYLDQAVVISSDPPYYDNIPYADISDFFYVWLQRSLKDVWPELFRRISSPKMEELVADNKRHGGRDKAEAFFMSGMVTAISRMRLAATNSEPLAIYYAFKQSEAASEGITSPGWASFLQAVIDAGLLVDGTWPIRTEATNALKADLNALASSIVLVCRKRTAAAATITRADFIRQLKRELPDAIDDIRKAGVGPVDMQQSVIGPGMGVFSRYAKVLEDDDSAMRVRTALSLINRVWEEIDQELDAAFDAETQVALAWFATYGFDARASGELITLANAKNIGTNALFESGVFKDLRGKAALTPRPDLPKGWTPATDKSLTVWECVQHTARVLNAEDGGGAAAGRLVAEMGPKAAEARALAYRLFEIATQKGWATEALIYNELAQEWPKLEDLASTADVRAATTTVQAELF
jgi:putative DNA methylase